MEVRSSFGSLEVVRVESGGRVSRFCSFQVEIELWFRVPSLFLFLASLPLPVLQQTELQNVYPLTLYFVDLVSYQLSYLSGNTLLLDKLWKCGSR
jgi:hypothetical protein